MALGGPLLRVLLGSLNRHPLSGGGLAHHGPSGERGDVLKEGGWPQWLCTLFSGEGRQELTKGLRAGLFGATFCRTFAAPQSDR